MTTNQSKIDAILVEERATAETRARARIAALTLGTDTDGDGPAEPHRVRQTGGVAVTASELELDFVL